uniref:Uncharacterized protein n=1 Tax=Oryza nivara TaxID=4536 RepID=A0A0E0IJR3_ORYNI
MVPWYLADEKTDEGSEPERRGNGGELEGDLTEAAPSSSSSAVGDDDDDPFLSTGFVSTFSAFSRERERLEGRGRQRGVRWHERLCASSPPPLTAWVSVEEEEVAVVRTTTTTSRRHGRSARCLLGTREKKDGDGGRAIGPLDVLETENHACQTEIILK